MVYTAKEIESVFSLYFPFQPEPALFQKSDLYQSSSTPDISGYTGSGKLQHYPTHCQDTGTCDMDEGDHTHGHTHKAMPLQDRACPVQHKQPQPLTTFTTTATVDTPLDPQQGTTAPPSPLPSPPPTLREVEPQVLNPLEEEENPMPQMKPPPKPSILPLWVHHHVSTIVIAM